MSEAKGMFKIMKRFLTVFLPTENVHLYKDVGMIPYCLARFYGYQCGLAYMGEKIEHDSFYEKYVNLLQIKNSSNVFGKYINLFNFVYKNAGSYDVINFYHLNIKKSLLLIGFKFLNPRCKSYLKLDLDEIGYRDLLNKDLKWKRILINYVKYFYLRIFIDTVSVESKQYYNGLKLMKMFRNKLIYLPNGIFVESTREKINMDTKNNIILTVGRIGSEQKNNELLVQAIEEIPIEKIRTWKVYFVGPVENSFRNYVQDTIRKKKYLENVLIIKGNVVSKDELYSIYEKSKIFCLTSRWESFGIVILEAMYFKNYVISTEYAAIHDLLNEGKFGRIIPNESMIELKNAIEKCIDNKIATDIIVDSAQNYMVENFSWNTIVYNLVKRFE